MEPKDAEALALIVDRARVDFALNTAKHAEASPGKMAGAIAEHVSAQIQLFAGILRNALLESAS